MKKVLSYCFIILLCLSFVACKDNGNSTANNNGATTPLEGTWKFTDSTSTPGETDIFTLVFAGANCSMVVSEETALDTTNPNYTTDMSGTSTVIETMTGTFRLDNNQILATPKTMSIRTIHVVTTDSGTTPTYQPSDLPHTDDSGVVSVSSSSLNQETTWGTYSLNGNTLRVSDPSNASNYKDFTKQ